MSQCGATTTRGTRCRNPKWSCPNHAMPQWITMAGGLLILNALFTDIDSLPRGKTRFPEAVLGLLHLATMIGLLALMIFTVLSLFSRSSRKMYYRALLVVGGLALAFFYGAGFF